MYTVKNILLPIKVKKCFLFCLKSSLKWMISYKFFTFFDKITYNKHQCSDFFTKHLIFLRNDKLTEAFLVAACSFCTKESALLLLRTSCYNNKYLNINLDHLKLSCHLSEKKMFLVLILAVELKSFDKFDGKMRRFGHVLLSGVVEP